VLTRQFGGRAHRVTVTDDAFEYNGRRYTALSTVAKTISGTTYNGFRFFKLKKPWSDHTTRPPFHKRRRNNRQPRAAATES
jgi:hypothetical protein